MGYRKIIVGDREFEYQVFSSGIKIKHKPVVFISMSDWTGWSWDDLERAKWKHSSVPEVTPSMIASYIRANLL